MHIAVVVSTKALHKCDVALILKFVVNGPHVRTLGVSTATLALFAIGRFARGVMRPSWISSQRLKHIAALPQARRSCSGVRLWVLSPPWSRAWFLYPKPYRTVAYRPWVCCSPLIS